MCTETRLGSISLYCTYRNTIELDVGINYGVSMGWITGYYGNVTVLYGNAVVFTILKKQ